MTPMHGRTVLITGANTGIGLATATGLAKLGARVVMVARDRARGEAARTMVQTTAGNGTVTLLLADLSRPAAVQTLAAEVQRRHDRLDVLINNAALIPPERTLTANGLETQFAVNHLAYYGLTLRLLPLLRASPAGRIVNVASEAHRHGRVEFDDLHSERQYHLPGYPIRGWQTYSNTKLMNVLFTYELARRLEHTRITANCLHPGVIGTQLTRTLPSVLHRVYRAMMPAPERGAYTSITLASAPELAKVNGRYLNEKATIVESSRASHDRSTAQRLWHVSADLLGLAVGPVLVDQHI